MQTYIRSPSCLLGVFQFPRGMRLSTLEERGEFYRDEFEVDALSGWIGQRKRSLKLAMILGRHTGIVMPSREQDKDNVVIIDDWDSAHDLRSYALDYLPESMYYDRNRYVDIRECAGCVRNRRACSRCNNFDGQQLAFDLDPENVDCPYHGHIGQRMQSGRGLSFCMIEFKAVRRQALLLSVELREKYSEVRVVYSGRGFHVVVDDEDAYLLARRERIKIARACARRYSIDEWVTAGGSRLMRLPYSLNSLVSRKCMVMKDGRDLLQFDPRTSRTVLPKFVRSA